MESEVVILPEMELAGVEALIESRARNLGDAESAIAVYLAMRMVYFMAVIKHGDDKVH